jgi:hypothetical protein
MYLRLFPLFMIFSTGCTLLSPNHDTMRGRLIYEETFDRPLDTGLWKTELQPSPGSAVGVAGGRLSLQTGAGVTVWLNKRLSGNIMIVFDRKVIMGNGKFDRLSDLNQFWMATDPLRSDLFTRSGKLEDYDSLRLYYVGMGGNSNSTTRFRKYDGKGNRELIGELLDTAHLLLPNHTYSIKIVVNNGEVSYWMDGKQYFTYKDPSPLTSGYFGFRSTKSNQEIDNLKIYQLP